MQLNDKVIHLPSGNIGIVSTELAYDRQEHWVRFEGEQEEELFPTIELLPLGEIKSELSLLAAFVLTGDEQYWRNDFPDMLRGKYNSLVGVDMLKISGTLIAAEIDRLQSLQS